MEHQTTNLGVGSSNLSGRAKWINDLRQFSVLAPDDNLTRAHNWAHVLSVCAPARRPRTVWGDNAWANHGSCRARRRKICRLIKPRFCCVVVRRNGRRRRSRRHSARFSVSWPTVNLRSAASNAIIRTSEHFHVFSPPPRLSVRMFGSGGKKRANASSNCAAL